MADDSEDDPQLKSLRAVWLEMRDEAPPSRGLDALMAAARTQAATLATPPWWKRLFDQLRRPSVLAFASLVLLIGGAVVLTRHDDAIEKAQPTSVPVRETETPAANKDTMAPLGAVAPTAPTLAEPKKPVDSPVDNAVKADTRNAPAPHANHGAPRTIVRGQGESAFERPAPPPPPPPAMTPDKTATESVDATTTTSGAKVSGQPQPQQQTRAPAEVLADQLATQMRSAAARGDCDNAKAIAARIARQDPAYYRERVAAEISKCGASTPKAAADVAH